MAASKTTIATLINPSDSPPYVPVVHILPPSSSTTSPAPVPVFVPSLSPTTDPCGDSVLQPAIFSPTAATIPGIAQPVRCSDRVVKGKDLKSLLEELSLPSEEALFTFVQDGFKSALLSVEGCFQQQTLEEVTKKISLMSERWTAGGLSPTVKCHLGCLVAALKEHHLEEAQELQQSLMAEHSSEVSEWIVAIQEILQELQTKDSKPAVCQQEAQGLCQTNTSDTCTAVQNSVASSTSQCESQRLVSGISHGRNIDLSTEGSR